MLRGFGGEDDMTRVWQDIFMIHRSLISAGIVHLVLNCYIKRVFDVWDALCSGWYDETRLKVGEASTANREGTKRA